MNYKIVVENYSGLIDPFKQLAKGLTFQQVGRFEKTTSVMFAYTQTRVHVDTGRLKASGRTNTHFDGDEWSGEIEYLRKPGIFELARGNIPTITHPEGAHNFFEGLESFVPVLEQHVEDVFRDAFDKGKSL